MVPTLPFGARQVVHVVPVVTQVRQFGSQSAQVPVPVMYSFVFGHVEHPVAAEVEQVKQVP